MKPKLTALLLVLCLVTAAYAETIIQSASTPPGGATTLTFSAALQSDSFIRITSPSSGLAPSGCAASWSVTNNGTDFVATGLPPFSGQTVKLTPGRTPPKIDATGEEVGP